MMPVASLLEKPYNTYINYRKIPRLASKLGVEATGSRDGIEKEKTMKKTSLWILLTALLLFPLHGQDFKPAPDFTIKGLNGQDLTLSDYQGKVIFLNFWATWCSPCKAEIPGFIEIFEKYKDRGMVIIGISLDSAGEGKIREFVEEYKITYPVAKGSMGLAREYGTGRVIPETFIIDQQGHIRHKHIGYMDKDTLESYFLELAGVK